MAYEMKEGEFTLFKNDKKTEPNHPDYTGRIMVNGVVMRTAAWIKQKDGGLAYFSGKVSEFQQREQSAAGPVADPINPTGAGPLDTPDDNPPASAKEIVQQRNAAQNVPIDSDLPF